MKKILTSANTIIIVLLLAMTMTITGCKSKKVNVVDTSGDLKTKSQNEVIEDVITHELDYETITTKGKVSLNGKEFTAIFKLVKDEFIQASIRPVLGIEAMRMDITPDKAILIDRLGGQYSEVSIGDSGINDLVAFNFYNLQALLTNQLFVAGNKMVTKDDYNDFKVIVAENNFILQTRDKNDLTYNFSVDASDRIVATNVTYPAKEMSLIWSYDQFVEDGRFIYPTNMLAEVKIKKKTYKVGVSYSDLDVNTDFNLDKSIPSKYKKIEIKDLVGSYMKLK